MAAGLSFLDDDGTEVELDPDEARALLLATGDLEGATVSACPDCRSRVLAAVAFVDVLDHGAPHARGPELLELADDAPTLHLFVVDGADACAHPRWRDPLFDEWCEVVEVDGPRALR
jgi:hypothetical protein